MKAKLFSCRLVGFIKFGIWYFINFFLKKEYNIKVIFKEDTISINHNWFNGANVHRVFTALVRASGDIQTELKEYAVTDVGREQLETILKSHHGMNFSGLEQLLQTV